MITANEPVGKLKVRMRKLLWSFSDAGMKLVYLIFCDDMVLNDKKQTNKQTNKKKNNKNNNNNNNKKQQQQQQQPPPQKKKKTINLTMSCLRTVKCMGANIVSISVILREKFTIHVQFQQICCFHALFFSHN